MIKLLATVAFGLGVAASSSAYAAEQTVTLAVQHMTCAACPRTVKASLQAVPGVTNVVVSAADKTAVVTYDDSREGDDERRLSFRAQELKHHQEEVVR
jgi:periplasmic mercuric ion binding protein